jgi:septal ring factor EnvC (AmiA/AmiB activator)
MTATRSLLRPAAALLAALLVLAWLPLAAEPPSPEQQLQDAERARAADLAAQRSAALQARAAAEEERRLAESQVATAARLRDAEDALAAASARVADLEQQRQAAETRLAERAADLAPLLPLIERLSLYPAETLLAVPRPPEQAVRGVLVLGGLASRLEREAALLRTEQAQLASLQQQLDDAMPALAAAQDEQTRRAAALDAEIEHMRTVRSANEDIATAAARRAAAEAAKADGLRAAIARIEAERQAAEARAREEKEALARPSSPDLGEARGQLTAPVAGSIVRSFGEATEAGPASGVSYLSPPAARVVSPCAGRVAFAAPFRSFGLLLIVDCGGGTHVVLSGLFRIDAEVGQTLAPGEPVGVMPSWDPRIPGSNKPLLYVELRRNGVPVNPAPFLHAGG